MHLKVTVKDALKFKRLLKPKGWAVSQNDSCRQRAHKNVDNKYSSDDNEELGHQKRNKAPEKA